MKGACHCGSVTIEVANKPDYVNFCDCTLCAKTGGAWGYYTASEVTATGPTRSYRRADYEQPAVEIHFCETCGTTTHWVLTEHCEGDRMGVNVRIFEPAQIAGIEARILDGRNWCGDKPAEHRRTVGIIGTDVFI